MIHHLKADGVQMIVCLDTHPPALAGRTSLTAADTLPCQVGVLCVPAYAINHSTLPAFLAGYKCGFRPFHKHETERSSSCQARSPARSGAGGLLHGGRQPGPLRPITILRRGYCCRSGCRHCPYGFKKAQIVRIRPCVFGRNLLIFVGPFAGIESCRQNKDYGQGLSDQW